MMKIVEEDKSNTFLSDDTYLHIKVNDGENSIHTTKSCFYVELQKDTIILQF